MTSEVTRVYNFALWREAVRASTALVMRNDYSHLRLAVLALFLPAPA